VHNVRIDINSVVERQSMHTINSPSDFVDITILDPSIVLDIRYATPNNFTGVSVYDNARCFLRCGTAHKLINVQRELSGIGLGVKVFDAYRPRSVSNKFWELIGDERYVAHPAQGSHHNRGASVDVTLINLKANEELKMPSAFDDFSQAAHRQYESMSPEARQNCFLLEQIMHKHGFIGLATEWWHFDDIDWEAYDIADLNFNQIDNLLR